MTTPGNVSVVAVAYPHEGVQSGRFLGMSGRESVEDSGDALHEV